jgi:isopentenyl-diphosphate Delta-isomerase
MVEMIIEVDKNDNQVGLRPRNHFYNSKHIHRVSHLILFNSKNEILLQLRSPTKKLWPNLFTYSVDGTVVNESYEDCIQREMQEIRWMNADELKEDILKNPDTYVPLLLKV